MEMTRTLAVKLLKRQEWDRPQPALALRRPSALTSRRRQAAPLEPDGKRAWMLARRH